MTPRALRVRPRILLLLSVVLLLAFAGCAAVRHHDDGADARRQYLDGGGWPTHGQAAYQIGDGAPVAGPGQRPVPIASVAKVMTAYLVLQRLPLRDGQQGPSILITDDDVRDYRQRKADGQSVVRVRAGERLSERDALEALLLPSANNVALLLARLVSHQVPAFVAAMNATAQRLEMRDTTYTDPSGYDPATVSTAADQLRLAEVVTADDTFTDLVALTTARIPEAGTVHNTDTLVGVDGFVGIKTGSDDAAGGCFMFETWRVVTLQPVAVLGVVLGQPGDDLVTAGLTAARQLADHVAPTVANA